ncbi:MAG: alpha/beta fold hydrolase [Actinobacteria bacterium]|nr:alpha/beta fold hydrolase [Actinomycetota bacterium]
MEAGRTQVVFVHGLWLHADSWSPWVDAFNEVGYSGRAIGWPGDGDTVAATRAASDRVANHGLAEIVAHHAAEIAKLGGRPIVIGHSFGGLIAQRLLSDGVASAAVAIDPAPAKGVLLLPPSAFRVAAVALRNPANRKRAVFLTKEQFRYGFGNALSRSESDELWERWAIPSPGKPLFDAAFANFAPHSPAAVDRKSDTRGPLLITAGGKDHTVPAAVSRQTQKLYRRSSAVTDLRAFPNRGHSLTIDSGWREVADAVLAWLGEQRLH